MALPTHERADPANFVRIAPDVRLGRNVAVHCFVNLYGCRVGDDTRIGAVLRDGVGEHAASRSPAWHSPCSLTRGRQTTLRCRRTATAAPGLA